MAGTAVATRWIWVQIPARPPKRGLGTPSGPQNNACACGLGSARKSSSMPLTYIHEPNGIKTRHTSAVAKARYFLHIARARATKIAMCAALGITENDA